MTYAMHRTMQYDMQYDVCYAYLSTNPSANHWKSINKVVGYLKIINNLGLFYFNFLMVLEGYSNVS